MNRVEFEVDDNVALLIETMAKSEGVDIATISKEALGQYLKKFTEGCITTLLRKAV